jgi:hypothetical protein
MKEEFDFVLLPKGTVIVTQKELKTLNAYSEKVRRELIKDIFSDVEEMLRHSYRIEDGWAGLCKNEEDRGKYLYGRNLCEKLIIDLQKIERKYEDEG